MDKDKIKAEIERIEELMKNKSSKFIQDELKQYLKILKSLTILLNILHPLKGKQMQPI